MRTRAVAVLVALPGILALGLLVPSLGASADSPSPQLLAGAVSDAQTRMASDAAAAAALRELPAPTTPIDQVRRDMQVASSDFGFRDAVRREQVVIYQLAADSTLETTVVGVLPRPRVAGIPDAAAS
jgi:hypothetical protein